MYVALLLKQPNESFSNRTLFLQTMSALGIIIKRYKCDGSLSLDHNENLQSQGRTA